MSGPVATAAFVVQVITMAWAVTAAFRWSLEDWAAITSGFASAAGLWWVAGRWIPFAVCAGLAGVWLAPRLAGWVKR